MTRLKKWVSSSRFYLRLQTAWWDLRGTYRQHKSQSPERPVNAAIRSVVGAMATLIVDYIYFPFCLGLGRLLTTYRLRLCRPRSLWGITPILTLPLKVRADRLLGIRGTSLVLDTYYITNRFDVNVSKTVPPTVRNFLSLYIPKTTTRKVLLGLSLLRYDFFNYFFDCGLLPKHFHRSTGMSAGVNGDELSALTRAGKRIFLYAYGADVRTRERTLRLGRYNFCMDCPEPGRFCVCDEATGSAAIDLARRYATILFAMGDMVVYVPGAVNTFYWPVDIAQIEFVGVSSDQSRPLRVVHSPNHPHFKGTKYLEAAVERLRAAGTPIELCIVSGVSNTEARRAYAEADVVAEQFIGGFHGYTALEAMAAGKPVISYLSQAFDVLGKEDCPIINANPDNLEKHLEILALDRKSLAQIGARGRRYVETYYSIEAFAVRLGESYLSHGELPKRFRQVLARNVRRLSERAA